MEVPMSRTPIIRRIATIAVAIAIPFATASSAEAFTHHRSGPTAPVAEQPVGGGLPDGGPPMTTFRSSWS
jgi:hypothetical protein